MLISDVLRHKGHDVVMVRPTDPVALAVNKLAEHRIGAVLVQDQWMKPVGIFSDATSSMRWRGTERQRWGSILNR